MEADPVRFLGRDLEELLDRARADVAAFLGADAEGLAFIANATSGVNTVLRSIDLRPGDEILVTDHEYNAVVNTVAAVADRAGARVVTARVPFPVASDEEVVEAITARATGRTRIAVLSHGTSPTALVFPAGRVVAALGSRGIDTLVDGAHAPGMVPLSLDALGAAYYVGNGHKWLCGPKGAAFLHVRRDRRETVRPLVISHGANAERPGRSRFRLEFDWTGTDDPSPYLALPEAIRFLGSLLPGGWPELMAANHALALAARDVLCRALDIEPPCPAGMLGSMAALPLPEPASSASTAPLALLEDVLAREHRIEVPVMTWPVAAVAVAHDQPRCHLLRVSAQHYNELAQYEMLAERLRDLLGR
jgi:isopenicillin-N epimerase